MPGVEVGGTAELVGGSLEVTGAEVAAKSAVGNTAETGGVVRVEDMAAVTLGAVGWVTDMALTALVGAGLAAISKAKEALGVARDAEERAVQTTVGALTAAVMEVEAVLKVDETMAVATGTVVLAAKMAAAWDVTGSGVTTVAAIASMFLNTTSWLTLPLVDVAADVAQAGVSHMNEHNPVVASCHGASCMVHSKHVCNRLELYPKQSSFFRSIRTCSIGGC